MKNIILITILSALFSCGRSNQNVESTASNNPEKPNFVCSVKRYQKISKSDLFPGQARWTDSVTLAIFSNSKLVAEEHCSYFIGDKSNDQCSRKAFEQKMKQDPRCQKRETASTAGFKTMKYNNNDYTYVLIADNMDKDRAYGHTSWLDREPAICNRFGKDWNIPRPKNFNRYMAAVKRSFNLKADIVFAPTDIDHFCSIEDQQCDDGKYNLSQRPAAIICQKQ